MHSAAALCILSFSCALPGLLPKFGPDSRAKAQIGIQDGIACLSLPPRLSHHTKMGLRGPVFRIRICLSNAARNGSPSSRLTDLLLMTQHTLNNKRSIDKPESKHNFPYTDRNALLGKWVGDKAAGHLNCSVALPASQKKFH